MTTTARKSCPKTASSTRLGAGRVHHLGSGTRPATPSDSRRPRKGSQS
jgi:hypothetical protein